MHTADQSKPAELVVSTRDATGLRAYLRILTIILKTASASDFDLFVSDLEQLVQIKPLWSLFLQLMCHPVPQVRSIAGL